MTLALVVALVTLGKSANADSARVALVRPATTTASVREALARIQGELTADGFAVSIVDAPGAVDAPPNVAGADGGAFATIEFVIDAAERVAELRVVDRMTSKTVLRRVTIETPASSRFAEVLAVRAVELLRASLVELLIRTRSTPPVAAPPAVKAAVDRAAKWAASALEPKRQSTWGFDAGTAVVVGFGGIGPALLGVLRIRATLDRSFELRVTLSGLGTSARVEGASGSASVNQQFGLAEFVATPWSNSPLHPVVSLGAGPLYVSVEGRATWPYVGEQSSGWAVALDAGTGVELRLSQHFDLSFETHAFVTRPYQVTRFLGQEGARISEPSLLGTLTVVGWL